MNGWAIFINTSRSDTRRIHRLQVERFQQLRHSQPVVLCHTAEDAFERAELDGAVIGNHFVMLAALLRGDAEMRTVLAGHGRNRASATP